MSSATRRRRAPLPVDRDRCGQTLEAGLDALGKSIDAQARARLLDYLEALALWNATHNLTAVRRPQDMVTRHLLDCLAIADYIDASPVADVGSGAGLPGLVLATVRPDLSVTLFEANGKKVAFLRHARRTLALDNVDIAAGRVEQAPGASGFAWVVTRAFASADETLAVAGHLLAENGRLGLMKGRDPHNELVRLPAGFVHRASHEILVPGLAAERRFTVIARAPA